MKSALSQAIAKRKAAPLYQFVDESDSARLELVRRIDEVYVAAMTRQRVGPEGEFYDAPDCMAAIRCLEVAAGWLGVRELELPKKPPQSLAGFFTKSKEPIPDAPH